MARMRIPLTLALVLLALLSMVNVFAYKQGVIKDSLSVTVRATDSATLALAPVSSTNSFYQAKVSSGGVLQLNFGAGINGTHSLQKTRTLNGFSLIGDDVLMKGVFSITNNSTTQCVDVSVYVTGLSGGTQTNLTEIRGRPAGGGTWQADTQLAGANGTPTAFSFKLGMSGSSKNQMLVDFHWVANNTVSSSSNLFTVEASAKDGTCP